MATNQSDPVGRVYAVALYETANERGVVGKVYEGLQTVLAAWNDKSFRDFFTSPRVPRPVKLQGMAEALKGRVPDEVLNFVLVLVAKGREPLFDNIVAAFAIHRDEAENRAHAFVEAGSPFSEAEKEEVKAALARASGGKEIVLHYDHKAELLGGARIRLGDLLVDTTLRTRLQHLARAVKA